MAPQGKRSAAGVVVGQRRQGLIVVGMHRSGTSALTRVLSLMGASLPKTLIQPCPGVNETGFWESQRIVTLHEEILHSIGSRWDDVLPLNPAWFASPGARDSRDQLVALMREEYGDAPLFVIKDPRVSRLVPLWIGVLEDLDVEPLFVHIVRNPLEVGASLWTRDGFPQAKSLLLWLGHILAAEHATRGRRRAYVQYDELLRDPMTIVERLGRDLALDWPCEPSLPKVAIEQFLSREFRHHFVPDEELLANREVSAWVREAYGLLASTAEGQSRANAFDALRFKFLEGSAEYGKLVATLERELQEEYGQRCRLEAHAATLQGRVGNLLLELDQSADHIRRLQSLMQQATRPVIWLRALRWWPLVLRSGVFDASHYRAAYRDVGAFPGSALFHFLCFGAREDRDPHPLFNTSWYKQTNPDVADFGIIPLVHYLLLGAGEGRDPHPDFSTRFYLERYPDARISGLNPLVHYIRHGRRDGRRTHPGASSPSP